MKKKLYLTFLCLSFLAFSGEVIDKSKLQNRNKINYKVNEQKGFTGTAISKYENEQLKDERNYKDGKENGLFKVYYGNGQLKWELNFKEGEIVK
ncbi:MAG: hypothetical protein ACRC6B_04520 [Fusobacteriaceae bacterium]